MATADKEMENSNAVTDIRAFNVDDVSANPQKPIDVNRYATKKTIAQGMLDIALLTANASQLKYILQVGEKHEFYTLMLVLISTSIVLQVLMGVLFLSLNLMRDCRLHLIEYKSSALIINHIAMGMSFAVTAINLLISAFDPGLGRFVPPTSLLDSPSISSLDSIIVGVLFLIIGGMNINKACNCRAANILNDVILIIIFLISAINIIAGIFILLLSQVDYKNPDSKLRAAWLDYLLTATVSGFLVTDIMRMVFGLDPALPCPDNNCSDMFATNFTSLNGTNVTTL
ncbi:hypothetical protein M8J77_006663 [Diaphorina citri]|nr:hypothetical protein M8J77_006663 [Diaphorina citri]